MLSFLSRLRRSISRPADPRPTARPAFGGAGGSHPAVHVLRGPGQRHRRRDAVRHAIPGPRRPRPGRLRRRADRAGRLPGAIQNSDLPAVAGLTIQGDPTAPLSSIPLVQPHQRARHRRRPGGIHPEPRQRRPGGRRRRRLRHQRGHHRLQRHGFQLHGPRRGRLRGRRRRAAPIDRDEPRRFRGAGPGGRAIRGRQPA